MVRLLTVFLLVECLIVGQLLSLGPLEIGLFAREAGSILIASLVVLALQPSSPSDRRERRLPRALRLHHRDLAHRQSHGAHALGPLVPLVDRRAPRRMSGPRETGVMIGSSIVMIVTCAVGIAATIAHQKLADNCQ